MNKNVTLGISSDNGGERGMPPSVKNKANEIGPVLLTNHTLHPWYFTSNIST